MMRTQVQPGSAAKKAPAEKKEAAKSFLKKKADQVAGKNQPKPFVKKEEGTTKKVLEAKAPKKTKKEEVLAEARKKIRVSEEKRAEFKQRTKQSQAKRAEKRGAAAPEQTPAA